MRQELLEKSKGAAWAVAFVAAYVALDWASYISPVWQLNLTPWNPAPALGILFLLQGGRGAVLALFVAIVASDAFVRDIPGDLAITGVLGAVLTAGYFGIARLLQRHFPDGGMFGDRPGLLRWSVIVIVGSLLNGTVFVSTLLATGLLTAADWGDAVIRFWVGDGVGIFVTMPLLWWLSDRPRRLLFRTAVLRWETSGYAMLTLLSLWIAFVPGAEVHYRYFYVLFLPLVWAASRQGLAGAVLCVATLQFGMLMAGVLQQPPEISLFELQMRAFLLALVGFLIGVAVDEQRRSAADLRQSLRLAAAGEMAGALAHELNQPLAALSAYGSACEHLLAGGANDAQLRDTIGRMIAEARRAGDVVRRLRDFFRTGATRLELIALPELIEAVAAPFRDRATAVGVTLRIGGIDDVAVRADRLQIEVVLRNLLANAFDAVLDATAAPRVVSLNSSLAEGGRVVVEVGDNGPGLSAGFVDQAFEPVTSTKSSGLGLGLAISRAIAEAHGGSLTAESGGGGRFRLVLPTEPRSMPTHG